MKKAQQLKKRIQSQFTSQVIGLKGTDYEGLIGTIDRILAGDERETENESSLDIVVEFKPFAHMDIAESHPHLSGTGIEQVYAGEDEIGFFKEEGDEFAFTVEGQAVCPNCFIPITHVRETQYDDLVWDWDSEMKIYVKDNSGGTDGKKCPECDGLIKDDREFFNY